MLIHSSLMGYQDREQTAHEEESTEAFAKLMEALLTDRVVLTDEQARGKLKGTQTTINHFRETPAGFGVIETVNFTILDGATFMWDRRHPAAIAYGRIEGQDKIILTGGIFYSGSLRKLGFDPTDIDFLPESVGEIPGYPNQFRNSIAFRITDLSPHTLNITVGGMYPETRSTTRISGRNVHDQVVNHFTSAVKMHIPRI